MSNVIDIQERFTVAGASSVMREGRSPAAKAGKTGIVLDLAVKRASADSLSRDVKTCEEAVSLLEVTIDAAERISGLVGNMLESASSGRMGPEKLACLRDLRSRCGSAAAEGGYQGLNLISPVHARDLEPGMNPAVSGDVILNFMNPLPDGSRVYKIQARNLTPEGMGLPAFETEDSDCYWAVLQASDAAAQCLDYFRGESERLKSMSLEFTERWEKSLGRGHRVKRMDTAAASAGFMGFKLMDAGMAAGQVHNEERLRNRLTADWKTADI